MATTFTYNTANQIASQTRNNDSYAWNGHYNVDRSSTIDGLNRIMVNGLTTIGYDGRGNLTSSGTSTYSYNGDNLMLTAPNSVTLGWDPLGRMAQLASSSATTKFAYDGINLIAEYNASNTLQRRYVHGPGTDQPIVWYEGSGTTDRRFLLADERGSIVSVSNASGTVLIVNSYDEYGIPAATNLGRFQYTGQTWLPEIGLYHYKARMYSPTLGRFMQTDPIGYADGMNWYAYVANDPINFVDPLGLSVIGESGGQICFTQNWFIGYYDSKGRYLGRKAGSEYTEEKCFSTGTSGTSGFGGGGGGGGGGGDPPTRDCSLPESILQILGQFGVDAGGYISDAGGVLFIGSAGVLVGGAVTGNPGAVGIGASGMSAGGTVYTIGTYVSFGGAVALVADGSGRQGFIDTVVNVVTHRLPDGFIAEAAGRVIGEALDQVLPENFFVTCRATLP